MRSSSRGTTILGLAFGMGVIGIALVGSAGCVPEARPRPDPGLLVARGAYLAHVGGCNDCHTPKRMTPSGPVPDQSRLLSGYASEDPLPEIPAGVIGPGRWGAIANPSLTAWAGPWGVSFATNLTPHSSGLGPWSAETFIQAIRTGRHAGVGRPILPPMPWQDYAHMTDDDLRALFAYLRSLPPIANPVPGALSPTVLPPLLPPSKP